MHSDPGSGSQAGAISIVDPVRTVLSDRQHLPAVYVEYAFRTSMWTSFLLFYGIIYHLSVSVFEDKSQSTRRMSASKKTIIKLSL